MGKLIVICKQLDSLLHSVRTGDERSAHGKRLKILSLFEDLCRELENEPQPEPRPFDLEAAKRGEPIEVMIASDNWIEKQFVGYFIDGRGVPMVVYIHADRPDWVPIAQVRMKAPEQITMYANVRRMSSGAVFGALYDSKRAATLNAENHINGTQLATAFPVKITVNK